MLPPVFAEFVPLPPAAQWAIVSILGVALTVVLIWTSIRRAPPIGEDLAKLNLSIDALNKSVAELTEAHKQHISHAAEIEALQEKVANLERLREEDQQRARSYTAQSNERIFKRIDELAGSMAENFKQVERALGQVEGGLAALQKD